MKLSSHAEPQSIPLLRIREKNRQAYEVFIGNLLQSIPLLTVADALFGQFRDVVLVVFTATAGASSCYFLPKLLGNPLVLSLYPNMFMFFEKQTFQNDFMYPIQNGPLLPAELEDLSSAAPEKHPFEVRDRRNTDDVFHAPADMELLKMSSELKETKMEDNEEAAPDIDCCDAGNSLAVVDYMDEIYTFYRRSADLSCVSTNYMSTQNDTNEKMRGVLIDWLVEVRYKLELFDETLPLTVKIIDRFLACENVV